MKRLPRAVRGAVGIVLAFFAFQTYQASLLHKAFAQEEHFLAERLASGLSGVLGQAHRTKDDLSIYRIIDGLEQSPGILSARILKLAPEGMRSFPLKDGADAWGYLALEISDHFSRTLVRRLWLSGSAAAVTVWLGLFVYLQWLERESSRQRSQIVELTSLLATEKQHAKVSQERAALKAQQDAALLQKALAHMGEPTVVLDAQQRIAAASPSAVAKVGTLSEAVGRSWHEIPVLNTCGPGLERSLTSPGQAVAWPAQEGLELRFESDPNGLSGTWVTFIESKEVVKYQ